MTSTHGFIVNEVFRAQIQETGYRGTGWKPALLQPQLVLLQMPKILICILVCMTLNGHVMADPVKTGMFQVHIDVQSPLADRGIILKRMLTTAAFKAHFGNSVPMGQSINPQNETWTLYVPPQYDGSTAYGVLVWIPPGDDAGIPYGWQGALDSQKIIYIAAGNSGNEQPVYDRRVPLALTGYSYVLNHYSIDKNRVYVGGFSGGGVVASHIAPAFADIFSGGLFVSTADGINTEASNGVDEDQIPVPMEIQLSTMRSRGRYIFTIGADDPVNESIILRAFDSYRALCISHIKFLQIPNAGHENLSRRWLYYSLSYLDSQKPLAHSPTCSSDRIQ
ncbi:MAG: hypothetical protein WBR15_06725 [Gammaproteobacteria bacterium]